MKHQLYTNRLGDHHVAIFLFHGVIKENPFQVRNHNQKHLLEEDFYDLLKNLKEQGNAISINDLVAGKFQPRSFIISFDDGFENNFTVAAPILNALEIPAVFYITSGFVDQNLMSWIDQIDHAVEHTGVETVRLSFLPENVSLKSKIEKRRFLDQIRNYVKGSQSEFLRREEIVSEIFSVCDVKPVKSLSSPLDQKMSWQQVKQLNDDPLFSVGGHSHQHHILSYLSPEELQRDILTCLTRLKNAGLDNVSHYSYPEGLHHCFNDQVIEALKLAGVRCCPTAIDGVNQPSEDLFHLKRVTVV